MTTVFAFVGQHAEDPDRLLVVGEDGRHYEYQLPEGTTMPVVPDEEPWQIIDPLPALIEEPVE